MPRIKFAGAMPRTKLAGVLPREPWPARPPAMTEPPQIYLLTPPQFDPESFAGSLVGILDRHTVACLRLTAAGQDADALARAADTYREIAHARFVRTAIEVEVLRVACDLWPTANRTPVLENLDAQKTAVHAQEADRFHQLDYDFHRLLCRAAEAEFAFKTIAQMKTQVDRLCLLSLERPTEMEVLLADHTRMVEALEAQDFDALNATIRHHLARLDDVVAAVRESHTDYFED